MSASKKDEIESGSEGHSNDLQRSASKSSSRPDDLAVRDDDGLAIRDDDGLHIHEKQQDGVSRIEALYRVFPRNGFFVWSLYVSLACVMICYSLDQSTTSQYQLNGTNYFKDHAKLFGVIGTAEAIINAVSKPVIAKICDIFSRQTAYLVVLIFYTIGFIVVASSQSGAAFAAGRIMSEVGQAGFDLVTDIIVADLSPLEWRGIATALTSSPYIVLPWVGNLIAADLNDRDPEQGWRWGYGMFAILAPVTVLPVLCVLTYADRKAVKAGELSFASSRMETEKSKEAGTFNVQRATTKTKASLLYRLLDEMDFIGLFLLALAFSLILLPFSLYSSARGRWANPSLIAMLVCGAVFLLSFIAWEAKFARHPIMNKRIWYNRTFLMAVTIDIFYFMSGNLRSLYYSSYILLANNLSQKDWGFAVIALPTCALTVFGLLAGVYLRVFHRYKHLQIGGLCIRLVAMGLTYWATGVNATTVAVVWSQILNSLGGACSVVGTRVASQASVPHQDLASIIAQLALWTRLGGAIGSAISAAMWTGNAQRDMVRNGLSAADAAKIFKAPRSAKTLYEWGTPQRTAMIEGLSDTVRPIFLVALVLSVIPLIAGCLMPNYYLGKTQNAIDGTDNSGRVIENPDEGENAEYRKQSFLYRIKNFSTRRSQ